MKTIIQTIGPLYGEVVNGSVFGQPNGSEARPAPNTSASVTISGVSGKLTFVENIPGGALVRYTLGGVSVVINSAVPVKTFYVVKNASDETVATGTPANMQGPGAKKPTDGDSLTLFVELRDDYNNVIATSSNLTITAEVPSE